MRESVHRGDADGRGVLSTDWGRIYTDEDGANAGKTFDLQTEAGVLS